MVETTVTIGVDFELKWVTIVFWANTGVLLAGSITDFVEAGSAILSIMVTGGDALEASPVLASLMVTVGGEFVEVNVESWEEVVVG